MLANLVNLENSILLSMQLHAKYAQQESLQQQERHLARHAPRASFLILREVHLAPLVKPTLLPLVPVIHTACLLRALIVIAILVGNGVAVIKVNIAKNLVVVVRSFRMLAVHSVSQVTIAPVVPMECGIGILIFRNHAPRENILIIMVLVVRLIVHDVQVVVILVKLPGCRAFIARSAVREIFPLLLVALHALFAPKASTL